MVTSRLLAPLAALLLIASSASAQSEEDLDRAREQFAEGVQMLEAEQWADAATRFRAVLEIRATAQVKYNLAIALEHVGQLSEAMELLSDVVGDPDFDRRARRQARQLLERIEPRLGQLDITVPDEHAGGTVSIDGNVIEAERLGSPILVDPGTHRIELRAGTRVVASRSITVAERATEEVTLDGIDSASSSGIPQPRLDDELIETRERERNATTGGGSVTDEWWFWTAIAGAVLVVAGVVIGVVFATTSSQEADPVDGNLMPGVIEVMLP